MNTGPKFIPQSRVSTYLLWGQIRTQLCEVLTLLGWNNVCIRWSNILYGLPSTTYIPESKSNQEELKVSTSRSLSELLFVLHQLTHNMTTDCSLNYKFNKWKFQAQNMGKTRGEHEENMLCTQIGFLFLFWHSEQLM